MAKKGEITWNRSKGFQSCSTYSKTFIIKKYYGWIPFKNIKLFKKKKAETLYQSLLLIIYRVKGSQFIHNVM